MCRGGLSLAYGQMREGGRADATAACFIPRPAGSACFIPQHAERSGGDWV